MSKKRWLAGLVLGGIAFSLVAPTGRVFAQDVNSSIEALQKQVTSLLEMIKSLQAQIEAIRGGVTLPPVVIPVSPKPTEPDRGWDTIYGTLTAQSQGGASIYMWGTHQITEFGMPTYPVQMGKTYLVKAVNEEVLALLKKYEGQTVTLWGQLQYQNLEGGFWGFVAKKVITGTTTCPLPAAGTKVGYADDSVKVVQEVLKTDPAVYPEGLVTGYYGPLTAKAVSKFQIKAGLPATGVLDAQTKEKIEAKLQTTTQTAPSSAGVAVEVLEDVAPLPVIRCPIPPKPIPPPTPDPDQGFNVYSPSSGENWQPGQTYKIAWTQSWPTIAPTMSGGANTTFAPIGAVRITLHHYIACLYEGPVRCLIAEAMPYVITDKTDNDGIFEWTIPSGIAKEYRDSKLIITVAAIDGGMSGRSGVFTIGGGSSGENLPPVVSGVSGPTNLKVGETGTWTVKAYDPENGNLSYSVIWGDEAVAATPGLLYKDTAIQNTATFTHVYNYAGTFTPVFYVTDSGGQQAKASMSVAVGGAGSTNSPPRIISFPAIPSQVRVGEAVNFSWGATDSDSDVLSWTINWGDEGAVPGVGMCPPPVTPSADYNLKCFSFSAAHVWRKAGTYTVAVTVSDSKGDSDGYKFSVKVVDANLSYQILQFKKGWNFVAFTRLPDGAAREIRGVFGDWLPYIDLIKTTDNGQELVFDKNTGVETLKGVVFGKGYKVYANTDFSMYVYGLPTPDIEFITLRKISDNYFNYMGNSSLVDSDVDIFFGSILDKINLVKAIDGTFWIPGSMASSLKTIKSGFGYEVSVKEDAILN